LKQEASLVPVSYTYVFNFQGEKIQYIFQVDSPRKIY